MNKTNIWKIKDMVEYACQKYPLNEGYYSDDCKSQYATYKREIRRVLVDCNLVVKDEEADEYIYELPEEIAKTFIDETMKEYFTDPIRVDKEKAKAQYSKQDEKLNKESFDKMVEESDYLSDCYEDDIDPYAYEPIVTQDEIEKLILSVMIKAIFNQYYEFDEERYKKDYTELKRLINTDDINETYQNGYSYLKNKIDNPINNYCIKKK